MKRLIRRGLDEPRLEIVRSDARFVLLDRTSDFEADIEFDADGFVTLYHDYPERIA